MAFLRRDIDLVEIQTAYKVDAQSTNFFEKVVAVLVKRSDRDERLEQLSIRVMLSGPTSRTASPTKALRIQISSDTDPFFLHSLEVNEEEFQGLKDDQSILVDFNTFPAKVVELLEQCIAHQQEASPKFLAVLECKGATTLFSIIETNQFKHLSHIGLIFRPGTDSAIKSFLSEKLLEARTTIIKLQRDCSTTSRELTASQSQLAAVSSELRALREDYNTKESNLRAEFTTQLAAAKERALEEVRETLHKAELDKAELGERLEKQNSKLRETLAAAEDEVKTLTTRKHEMGCELNELRISLTRAQATETRLAQEITQAGNEMSRLRAECSEKAQEAHTQAVRISSLETENRGNTELIARLREQVDSTSCHREDLERSLSEARRSCQQAEQRASNTADELKQKLFMANKMEDDIKITKSKLKLRNMALLKQESVLKEKENSLQEMEREFHRTKQELDAERKDKVMVENRLQETQGKLEETNKLLERNQQTIQWLNNQINEAQMSRFRSSATARRAGELEVKPREPVKDVKHRDTAIPTRMRYNKLGSTAEHSTYFEFNPGEKDDCHIRPSIVGTNVPIKEIARLSECGEGKQNGDDKLIAARQALSAHSTESNGSSSKAKTRSLFEMPSL